MELCGSGLDLCVGDGSEEGVVKCREKITGKGTKDMVKLDRETRDAIAMAVEMAVEKAVARRMEMYEEVWLTGEQLCEKFGMISEGWLEKNGKYLPRERMGVRKETGRVIGSRWGYPWHRINRWIQEDRGHVAIMLKGGGES